MQRIILLVLALSLMIAVSASAGRLTSTMITHLDQVFQAYCGCVTPVTAGSTPQPINVCDTPEDFFLSLCKTGYNPELGDPTITAAPGVLCIDPDYCYFDQVEQCWRCLPWGNFVGAAWEDPIVDYTIKNVTLVKECPEYVQCNGVFPAHRFTQQGTANIRTWWPLMYTTPSCTFTLTILYGTPTLYDDDDLGPNPPAWVHVEQWVWHVDADLDHLLLLLQLFHELPFGKDEVPLISDEPLYEALYDKIEDAIFAYEMGDLFEASMILTDFELEVMDACIEVSPACPNPTGPGTGIANTEENPACCKLLVDVEYILQTTGIGQQGK